MALFEGLLTLNKAIINQTNTIQLKPTVIKKRQPTQTNSI